MVMNSKRKGDIAEMIAQLYFLERNYSVSVPVGDNDKYDFIVDTGDKLLKIQVKSGNIKDDRMVIELSTRTHSSGSKNNRTQVNKYNDGDFDWLVAVDVASKQCYFIPPEKSINKTQITLRLGTRNVNNPNINWADE